MSSLNAIIIDDEPKARQLLRAMLEDYCPEVTVVADAPELVAGIKAINKYKPDLIFLDIEMPGYSGLDLGQFFDVETVDFGIIFTTAYNNYAIEAFKLMAIDYLLKPIAPNLLQAAVNRFQTQRNRFSKAQVQSLQAHFGQRPALKLGLPVGQSIRYIDHSDILLFKGSGAYTEVLLADGEKVLVSKNLGYFEDTLQHVQTFLRVHKSFIINIEHLTEYKKSDGGVVYLKHGTEVPISPDRLPQLLGILQQNSL